ncbi:MAG TPA: hypothetical protein VKM94_03940, partial [Blastocatellia bacterium]|nr:hypothetical protein [Blastocatellia bacterium]
MISKQRRIDGIKGVTGSIPNERGAEITLQLIRRSERTESGLQLVELQQVAAQVLCPTALTRAGYEAAAREGLGPRRSAQVNDR